VATDRADYQLKKKTRKDCSLGFLRSLYLPSLTSGYLWYSSFTAYAANDNSRIVGFTDQWTGFTHAQGAIF